jgi:hypothetical protein
VQGKKKQMKGNKDKTYYSEGKDLKMHYHIIKKVVFHDLKTEKINNFGSKELMNCELY